ncbi:MAG: Fic family protein [Nanoarchaeota archaeon]
MVNIRIMEKGTKKYYYLEHTLRTGNSFKNKRMYLGSFLPKDIEKIMERFMYEVYMEIYEKPLESIKKNFNQEIASFPKSAYDRFIELFMIRFTYDSTRIEGSTLTLKETADLLQEEVTPKGKSLRDVKETEAHRNVFYKMLRHTGDLTLATTLEWHHELFKEVDPEIAGAIRKHPVAIARSKVELALPAEIDPLLHEFFQWYKKNNIHPVIKAALVHLRFVTIHPFSDGNGRMSRIMMNFVLHKNGYPMLNIEYINRNSYYNALEKSQLQKRDEYFIQYFLKKYVKTHKKYVKSHY